MQARLIGYLCGLAALVIVCILAYAKVKDHFEAPIIKERDAAIATATKNAEVIDTLRQEAKQKEEANARIAATALKTKREKDALKNELDQLKKEDKAVRDWADTDIPLALDTRLRTLFEAGATAGSGLPETRLKLDAGNPATKSPGQKNE